jgi:hypothetical protein
MIQITWEWYSFYMGKLSNEKQVISSYIGMSNEDGYITYTLSNEDRSSIETDTFMVMPNTTTNANHIHGISD